MKTLNLTNFITEQNDKHAYHSEYEKVTYIRHYNLVLSVVTPKDVKEKTIPNDRFNYLGMVMCRLFGSSNYERIPLSRNYRPCRL